MSRIFFKLFFFLLLSIPLPGLNLLNKTSFANDRTNLIKGKVIDAETKAIIEYATISLFSETDTIPMQYTATNAKGEFVLTNLSNGTYRIGVNFMGFKKHLTLPFVVSGKSSEYWVETIQLQIETMTLGEIIVKSASGKPNSQLDKKTIYVDNQMSAAGGSAADLLHKLPSVSQSPDGNISIHGNSNLLIYINGKPSSLKGFELLENTAAAEIKKIELITSPSARYDASGSGGIINLITKRNAIDGINGNIQAAADHLGGYTADLLLNYKYNKFSFFTGIDVNQKRNQGDVDYQTNYQNQSSLSQTGTQKSQRTNKGARAGLDYVPTQNDKLSFSGNGGTFVTTNNGDWSTIQTNNIQFSTAKNNVIDENYRKGAYGGLDLTYEHKFFKPNKSISFSVLWNALNYDDHYLNQINSESGSEFMRQTVLLKKDYNNCQLNGDFSSPTGKVGHLELGYQFSFNDEVESYQSNLSLPLPPTITNQETQFNETIRAGYGTWQFKHRKLELKAGLRAEYLNRELITDDNRYHFKQVDLYPSLNSSLKIDSIHEILFNYTRRTDQLKTIQLDPLPRWYDFYNVMMGNPNLKNEITDKISADYIVNLKNWTFVSELYFYNISNKIEMIRSIYQNGIIQNRYENIGREMTTGVELNVNWLTNDWIKLNEKIDLIETHLDVLLQPISQKRSYRQWYSVTTASFNLSPTTMMELDFSYYGPALTAQSRINQCYLAGISFRKTFLNKKLSFTLTGRDFLGLYRKEETIESSDFNQVISMHNHFPIRFSLSYKFNHYKRDERSVAKPPLVE